MRFSTIFSTAILAASAFAAPYSRLRKRNDVTDNRAGAAVTSPPADQGGFVTVIGTFVVPGKADPNDVTPSAVSVWVGIDGYTNEVVIQAGLDSILDEDGDITVRTWVQWIPNEAVYVDGGYFARLPGDTVTVQVAAAPGNTAAQALFKNSNGSTKTQAGDIEPSQGTGIDMLNSEGGVAATAAVDGDTVTVVWQTA